MSIQRCGTGNETRRAVRRCNTRLDLQEALEFAGAGKVRATVATEQLENINDVFTATDNETSAERERVHRIVDDRPVASGRRYDRSTDSFVYIRPGSLQNEEE